MTIKHLWTHNYTLAAKPINIDLTINYSDFSLDLFVLPSLIYFLLDFILRH